LDNLGEYECLVIDNTRKGKNITDRVFYYKSDERVGFKFGCEYYWKYHYEMVKYKNDDTETEDNNEENILMEQSGRLDIDKMNIFPKRNVIDLKVNRA
jgi:hypothetical protein